MNKSEGSNSAPVRNRTGSRRAAPGEMGWTTERAAATTIRGARPDMIELSTCNLRPIVSDPDELGNCATSSSYSPASS